MTRDLCYREYYKPAGRRMMPVRWMAPESLVDGRHDIKSDVWSYGVVLYEMVTLGQQPYQGLGNDEIIEYIARKRKIMDPPEDCPEHWYRLMEECWKYNPRERPNFYMLVEELLEYVESKRVDISVFLEVRPRPFYLTEQFQTSFVINNPDKVAMESNYDDDNPYQPDPLSHFMSNELMNNEEDGYVVSSKNKRGADMKAGWGEGVALHHQNGIAEHEV